MRIMKETKFKGSSKNISFLNILEIGLFLPYHNEIYYESHIEMCESGEYFGILPLVLEEYLIGGGKENCNKLNKTFTLKYNNTNILY